MKASTRNRMMGTFHEMKGGVKVAVGNTFSSRKMAFSGRVERTRGMMQAKFGRVERIFGW